MNTSPEIEYLRLATMQAAIKLESVGMRRSRGKSVTAQARSEFSLSPRTKHFLVMQAIQIRMNEILGEIWKAKQ